MDIDVRALILAEGIAGMSLLALLACEYFNRVPKPLRQVPDQPTSVNWGIARLVSVGMYIAVLVFLFGMALRGSRAKAPLVSVRPK